MGTLTSVAKNKRNNRLAEQALRELETLGVLASLRPGMAYPAEQLHKLWRIVMLNQFHDILPGSSIGAVFDDSDRDYAIFFDEAEILREKLLAALAGEAGFVFNALGRERSGLVMLEAGDARSVQWNGVELPTQELCCADGVKRQGVWMKSIPAMGGAHVSVKRAPVAEGASELLVSKERLENGSIAVSFDKTGRISSILDKKTGREAILAGQLANRLQAYRDMPPEFDAWDIDASFEDQVWDINDLVCAEVVEEGPYRAAIRFEWVYESSRIIQVVALEAQGCRIDIDCHVDWHEHNTMIKAAFPLNVKATETKAEIQFGHVARPTHRNTSWDQARFETVMHRWVDMSEPDFGVALFNDCKYGYDAKDTVLRLTLLRSPTWPWAEADQGLHHFRYGIQLHHGLFDGLGVPALAEEFNLPLVLRGKMDAEENDHIGTDDLSLLSLEGVGVTIETVKQAEDGDGIIVRLWETNGTCAHARLLLPKEMKQAEIVDLLERDGQTISVEDGWLALRFSPFEIKCVRLRR